MALEAGIRHISLITNSPKMASPEERITALITHARAENQTVLGTIPAHASYRSEFNRFLQFVDSNPDLEQESVLSRSNIDAYFASVVAGRRGAPDTIKHAVYALQWFCKYRPEYEATDLVIDSSPIGKFSTTLLGRFSTA